LFVVYDMRRQVYITRSGLTCIGNAGITYLADRSVTDHNTLDCLHDFTALISGGMAVNWAKKKRPKK